MKKALILYAKSGALGHAVIARNYAELLDANGYAAIEGDCFAIDGKAVIRGGEKIYRWWLKAAPWFWQFLYKYWTYIPGAHWFKNYLHPRLYPKPQAFILAQKPDLIIPTHPPATTIVNFLKNKKLCQSKFLTTFSDWHTQAFHVYKHVDKYLVVTPEQIDDLAHLNIAKEKIAVSGILLSQNYYRLPDKKEARPKLGLPPDKKIILAMGGGMSWQIEETIDALSKIAAPVKILIVANAELKNKIDSEKIQIVISSELSDYFAASDLLISKPGGLTTAQAFMAKLPLLATAPLPGQEDENIKYLLSKKAIILRDINTGFTEQIEQVLSSPEMLKNTAENAYRLAPKNAPKIVLEILNDALYSDTSHET